MGRTIYGTHLSRTARVLWMAEELALAFDHVPYAHDDPILKTDAFRAINPSGAVPVLVDGDVVLSESLAITLYLAKTYGGNAWYPASGEATLWQWSLWAQGHLEPWIQRDQKALAAREPVAGSIASLVTDALDTLDDHLAQRDWLLANRFTVADLNVASVLSSSRTQWIDLSAHERVVRWLQRCRRRPAWIATRAKYFD
ncbi:MAG: glutathione S-transferase family protein [Pseudomonadota bacterium]